ncbi:cystatin domain-containing protein [Vibrio parahaemolyticus]|uniref:cystatin domain-containing protein n=1 Tax=Vibrio parahaemolyticus TaxID=670 RepID=UPI00358FD2A1
MTQENPICSSKNLVGGWSKKEMTSQAQEALDFALNSMVTDARLTKVLSVYSQVVNGVNYAIEFEMDNGEVYHTIVYRALDGEMSLSQPVERGKVCS